MDYPKSAISEVADKLIKHASTNSRIIGDLQESVNLLIINNQMMINILEEQNKKLKGDYNV